MTDKVYIEGLKVETLIGVYEFEREAMQALFLDLVLGFDCEPAGQTDDLNLALDYDRLAKSVRAWSLRQTFELLETYAEQLCVLLHQEFQLKDIQLKINKPAAVAQCSAVGIQIHRKFEA
jgi:dihydroneopterin aldolase